MAASNKKNIGRDYPLASTPKPKSYTADEREKAYSEDMSKYGYVTDRTFEKYKKK